MRSAAIVIYPFINHITDFDRAFLFEIVMRESLGIFAGLFAKRSDSQASPTDSSLIDNFLTKRAIISDQVYNKLVTFIKAFLLPSFI